MTEIQANTPLPVSSSVSASIASIASRRRQDDAPHPSAQRAPAASATSIESAESAASKPVFDRTPFAARVDEADDALKLAATDEEKLLFGHWIVGAWEDTLACRDCTKADDEVLASAKRTVVRENGMLRSVAMRCDRYRIVRQRRRLERLFGQSQLGERFRRRTFDTFRTDETNRRAYDACKRLADDYPTLRQGLLLAGGCGSGKTHLAAAIVHALIERGYRGVFLTSGRYLDSLKSAFGNAQRTRDLQEEARCADLLVLDDLGAERTSEWGKSELFALLNDRYEQMLPTVLTTNLSMKELIDRLGERTVSRIAEMTDGVRLHAPDRRLLRHLPQGAK